MGCRTLFAFCIFTAGLRVQSMPTSVPLPVSLPAKMTPPTDIWTSPPASPPASPSGGTLSTSVSLVTAATQTSSHLKNVSALPREETTSLVTTGEVTSTNLSLTSSDGHVTMPSWEHNSGTPEANVTATGSHSPAEMLTLTSPQVPASSPSAPASTLPEVSSASVNSNHSSPDNSTKPTAAATSAEPTAETHSAGPTLSPSVTAEPVSTETTPQTTMPAVVTCLVEKVQVTTASPGVIMQEVEHALSSGSIAAITVTVIAVVLLVFGVAAYLKIRHSSYGRLLDDHDYGSWGNYNNPLYDDS